MSNELFKHKEKGTIYKVIKTDNINGINTVTYKEDSFPDSAKPRIYVRDLYMFLKNMELIEDKG